MGLSRIHIISNNLLIASLPLFALTTLLQNVGAFSSINKTLVIPIFFLLLISLVSYKTEKWFYAVFFIFMTVWLCDLALTNWTSQAISEAPRSLFCILMCFWLYFNSDELLIIARRYTVYFLFVIVLWSFAILLSIPLDSSWSIKWGGDTYFVSFCASPFQLMPSALIVLSLNYFCFVCGQNKIYTICFMFLPIFCGLEGGSRTYFVSAIAFCLYTLFKMDFTKFEKSIFLVIFAIVVFYFSLDSGIANKMASVSSVEQQKWSNTDLLGALTSGRSDFWAADVAAFLDLGIFGQLIGNGFSFSFAANLEAVGNSIYAHNDFINILMESGYIGLTIYCLSIWCLFSDLKKHSVSTPSCFFIFFIWFFNAFINAFYSYTSTVISLLFLILAVELNPKKEIKKSSISSRRLNKNE